MNLEYKPHMVPCKVTGKCGSVTVRMVPAPRGAGIVAARVPKKLVTRVYNDELALDTYICSDLYGTCNQVKNCSNPKIKGAVVFHEQGPRLFDYSIRRLNHTWAFSGFPNVKSIMDVIGPYLNDLELGVNIVPTMQYSFSGFFTV